MYIEDEERLAEAVIYLLKKSNVDADLANNGEDGLKLAQSGDYDAIVLDIMLPKLSGWEVLTILRAKNYKTPIIMLSALSEVEDKVKALNIGADDYLAKPFKTAELVARLQALTRRPPLQNSDILEFGDLTYDTKNQTLNQTQLTAKESKLLTLFLRQPQQLIPKERILNYVWGNELVTDGSYVEVYISRLRQKLKQINSNVKISSQRGLGYKIIMEKK